MEATRLMEATIIMLYEMKWTITINKKVALTLSLPRPEN